MSFSHCKLVFAPIASTQTKVRCKRFAAIPRLLKKAEERTSGQLSPRHREWTQGNPCVQFSAIPWPGESTPQPVLLGSFRLDWCIDASGDGTGARDARGCCYQRRAGSGVVHWPK